VDRYTFSSVESCRLLGLDQVGTPAWSEDMHCNVTRQVSAWMAMKIEGVSTI